MEPKYFKAQNISTLLNPIRTHKRILGISEPDFLKPFKTDYQLEPNGATKIYPLVPPILC